MSIKQISKKRHKQYQYRLVKNILNKKLDATIWVLTVLLASGKITKEIFFNKSVTDIIDPWSIITEAEEAINQITNKQYLSRSIKKLQNYGLIEDNRNILSLTSKGERLVAKIKNYRKVLDKKWDKKYRIVIFDIPERQRSDRDWLRRELYFLNYAQLQKSVFISKHPLTKELVMEIKKRKIDKGVNYILADKIYDIQKEKVFDTEK